MKTSNKVHPQEDRLGSNDFTTSHICKLPGENNLYTIFYQLKKNYKNFPTTARQSPLNLRYRLNNFCLKFRSCLILSESNPETRKYFKSFSAISKEQKRHVRSKFWYIIHPYSEFR